MDRKPKSDKGNNNLLMYANTVNVLPKPIRMLLGLVGFIIATVGIGIGIFTIWKYGNYMGLWFIFVGVGAGITGYVFLRNR